MITALLFGAVLGLHVEEPVELDGAEAAKIAEVIVRSLQLRTQRPVAVDDPVWARLDAEEVVQVSMFGGPIKIRVVLEVGKKKVELRIPRDPSTWSELFDRAAEELFPFAPLKEPPVTPVVAVPPNTGSVNPIPWIILGGSAVALGAGAVLGASSTSIEDELSNGGVATGASFRDRESEMQGRALAANLCFAGALAGAATALVWLLLE